MRRFSTALRDELTSIGGERYRSASRAARSRMCHEAAPTTGYHGNHAIRLLVRPAKPGAPRRRSRLRRHGDGVREAHVVLREASDRIFSKRLRPRIPLPLPALYLRAALPAERDLLRPGGAPICFRSSRQERLAATPASRER